MSIEARIDFSEFQTRLAVLKRPQAPLVRALNRAIASGRTLARREVAKETALTQATVDRFLQTTIATPTRLTATLHANAKPLPLEMFHARGPLPSRGRPGGVRVRLPGGKPVHPRAFRAHGKRGRVGVFVRPLGVGRNPIIELHGPSVWQAYQRVEPRVRARSLEQLAKNVAHEIQYALSR